MANGKQFPNSHPKVAKCLERVHGGECPEHVTVVALHVFDCGDAVSYWYGIELDGELSGLSREIHEFLGSRELG